MFASEYLTDYVDSDEENHQTSLDLIPDGAPTTIAIDKGTGSNPYLKSGAKMGSEHFYGSGSQTTAFAGMTNFNGMNDGTGDMEDGDESSFTDEDLGEQTIGEFEPVLDGRRVLVFERPAKGSKDTFPSLLGSLKSRTSGLDKHTGYDLSDPISFAFSRDASQPLDYERLPGVAVAEFKMALAKRGRCLSKQE
ncbi:hypothetical protein HDU93_004900 [Gonapodya sp. JEL0774]|nr:hypothetical protein HDU93_004900 [Gonapodya sp. JEL0774]